nr:GNAT family N-acetyltransferase [Murinocardiopsis flavida]
MRIRTGGAGDVPALLGLFDQAVAWLAARGRAAQWGDRPWSERPERVDMVRGLVDGGDLWIAESGGGAAGALLVAEQPMPYVPAAAERELYIRLLITARTHAGEGIGAALLDRARQEAADRGIALLRVDCWAGGDGALIGYYERAGFTPTERIPVKDTEVQVFEQRLPG